jgi:hypothetical protein
MCHTREVYALHTCKRNKALREGVARVDPAHCPSSFFMDGWHFMNSTEKASPLGIILQ